MTADPAADLTVIILTRDEALHIDRCIGAIRHLAARVIVVDSGSTDATRVIAAAAGAEVVDHDWTNYAQQFNWALDNCRITTPWTMRLDADEVVSPGLVAKIRVMLADPDARSRLDGISVDRAIHFLGRKIRWGGIYPTRVVRIWRSGHGRIENRWMDEHVVVDGAVTHLAGDIADINLNTIGWWTAKHNHYATREAIDLMTIDPQTRLAGAIGGQAQRKRWLKNNFYARLPPGLRPMLYFLYRYFILLGFLDGWQGLAFHGLQGLWYRFLVDVKIAELRRLMKVRGHDLATVVEAEYGLKI